MTRNVMEFAELIQCFVEKTGKPLVFLRASGPHGTNDVDLANQAFNLYKEILDLEMYTLIFNNEFLFIEFDDIEEAVDFCEDHFPESQTSCPKEQYIHYSLYNASGQVILSN